jgi:cytochrome c biogenesis protein CcmG/thiol:disulfide interchange protein DsbE
MSRKLRLTLLLSLPLAGFLVLLWLLLKGLGNDPRLLPSALVDQPLPNFEVASLDDPRRLITRNDLKGEVALLNVWATWCPTCRAEHEMLNGLARKGIAIYGVNYKDEPDKARNWLATLGNPYRFNINDQTGQLGIDLGVYGAPETFLLDAGGVIRYRHVGAIDERVWQQDFVPRIQAIEEEQS